MPRPGTAPIEHEQAKVEEKGVGKDHRELDDDGGLAGKRGHRVKVEQRKPIDDHEARPEPRPHAEEGGELKEDRDDGHDELCRLRDHPREPEEQTVPVGGAWDAAEQRKGEEDAKREVLRNEVVEAKRREAQVGVVLGHECVTRVAGTTRSDAREVEKGGHKGGLDERGSSGPAIPGDAVGA